MNGSIKNDIDIIASGIQVLLESSHRIENKLDSIQTPRLGRGLPARRRGAPERVVRAPKQARPVSTGLKNALWINRYTPTLSQEKELAQEWGVQLVDIESGIHLGKLNLTDDKDVSSYCETISRLIKEYRLSALVGVFPPPVLPYILRLKDILILSSWMVQRLGLSPKLSQGLYEHRCFVRINF